VKATETGWAQRELARSALSKQKDLEEGRQVLIGVNKFVSDKKPDLELHQSKPHIAEEMKQRLAKLRQERDDNRLQAALDALRRACSTNENVVPLVKEAVRAHASIGEISGIYREVFGEFRLPGL